jgi:hypothetical protein
MPVSLDDMTGDTDLSAIGALRELTGEGREQLSARFGISTAELDQSRAA